MFQNLLADRFNLKFHKETKEGPVYALSVDKAGLKMKADGTGQALGVPIVPATGGGFNGTRVPKRQGLGSSPITGILLKVSGSPSKQR